MRQVDWLHSFLLPWLSDPTRYNICSKYSLILAVHSGSERCAGHLLLSRRGAMSVFLSLAHHVSPTWWMYMTCGGERRSGFGRQVLAWGGRWLCEPGSPLPQETDLWPWGSEIKSRVRSYCCWFRLRLVRGVGVTVCPPLCGWVSSLACSHSKGLSRKF